MGFVLLEKALLEFWQFFEKAGRARTVWWLAERHRLFYFFVELAVEI